MMKLRRTPLQQNPRVATPTHIATPLRIVAHVAILLCALIGVSCSRTSENTPVSELGNNAVTTSVVGEVAVDGLIQRSDNGDISVEDDGGKEGNGDNSDNSEGDNAIEDAGDVGDTITSGGEDENNEDNIIETAQHGQRGGVLRVAIEGEGDGLNPASNTFAGSSYIMAFPVLEPVVYWDEKGQWVPYLAESVTKVGDGSAWRIKLREGVRFHDGSNLDADDMIATFNAQMKDPVMSLLIGSTWSDQNPITRIDDHTVQHNLVKANAYFPVMLAGQLGMIVPSEWLEKAKQARELNQFPIGTGPFKVETREKDRRTVLVRNNDYWASDETWAAASDNADISSNNNTFGNKNTPSNNDTPSNNNVYLDRIEIFPITDTAVAAERLIAGEIDMLVTTEAESIVRLRDAENVVTIDDEQAGEDLVMLNTSQPPFDDIRVRKAITFATPRNDYIAQVRQGISIPADSMFHPNLPWYSPNVVQETDMPDLALPLVLQYCEENPAACTDNKINFEYQYRGPSEEQDRVNAVLIKGWSEYFNVKKRQLQQGAHLKFVALGNFEVVTWRQFGEPDPDTEKLWLQCSTISVISLNWPRHCDEDRDTLLEQQQITTDTARRAELWEQVQENVKNSYMYIFLAHTNWTVASGKHVQNVCGHRVPVEGTKVLCNNQGRVFLSQIWLEN